MSSDLTRNQLFFKGLLPDRISNPSKNTEYSNSFGLNLIGYDLYDEDIQNITNLIILTDKFNSLNIRLSDTLTDSNTLSKLLRKISLKRQFTSLGFYIKYLDDSLLEVFYDFIGKMQESVSSLKLMIKHREKSKENEIVEKILENLLKNEGQGLENLELTEFRLGTIKNLELLERIFVKNKNLKNVQISHRTIFKDRFTLHLSNIKNLKILNCQISYISHLPIEVLNLSYNNISKDGLKKLSKLLYEEKCTLQKLNLSNNLIGDDGCTILSDGISNNTTLISLNLSSNNILNKGVIELARSLKSDTGNKTIKKLNLSINEIENGGLIEFCQILKNEKKDRFTKIDFSNNNLSDRSIIEFGSFLEKHPTITNLCLTNKITNENKNSFFSSCKNLSQLKKVNFQFLDISESNSKELNEILLSNKNIQKIKIINNRALGPSGLAGISTGIEKNAKLLEINLTQCDIGDEGATALSNSLFRNLEIQEIILEDNKIGEKGTKSIADKLLGKTSLKVLNLSRNKINSKGGFYIGQGLGEAHGIQKLYLGYNQIEDEGCEFISKGLEKNNTLVELNLENNNISNKGINSICKYLKNNENLMQLILSGNKITEIDSDFYELFNWLKVIEISDNPLTQSGIIRIFQGSENNRLFKSLKFKYNSDDEYHFKCFNQNLKNIDLSFNRNINISLMKHILSLKYLSQLNLQIDNITDEGLQKIVNLIIESNTPIKDLKLNNNKITSEGSKHISELIKNCKTLKILDLSYNDLKSEGVKNICNTIISSNTDLKQLILNGNKCNDYCSDAIFNMLANSKKLLILSLCGNFFTNKGIDKILSSLRKNNTLKQLSLSENKIDNGAFVNLSNYLKFNKSLIVLEIKSARLDDESLRKLSEVFGQNNSLENLNLVDNNLGYEGLAKFGQYTSKNNNLNEIKILNNRPVKEQQALLKSCNAHLIFGN